MNILFLGLSSITSFKNKGIYSDLLRGLIAEGHSVFSVTSIERRYNKKTYLNCDGDNRLLLVKTFNIQKTNIFEKGIGTLAIRMQYIKAINKYFKGIKFDMILYPTPPITLYKVVKYFKKRDNAKTYLMLKDIFPQNAVDLGLMSTTGIRGLIYKYFRRQEIKLYEVSDKIGCMSQANVEYVLKHNPNVIETKVEIFPNCIEVSKISLTDEEKKDIRKKYNIPLDKRIFVYGGNLGKPQGIPFVIDCLKCERNNSNAYFLIIGDGTEYSSLELYASKSGQENFKLLRRLAVEEYDRLVAACDIGLLFLDYRFTIPNFPSRLLSYLQAGLPVLACTDTTTDVGKIIVNEGLGWWCGSNNVEEFHKLLNDICNAKIEINREAVENFLESCSSRKCSFHLSEFLRR